MPALFLSHGAPSLLLGDDPARRFLAGLGAQLPRPRAIVVVSAHWQTEAPQLTTAAWPETVHDFTGFPSELLTYRYPAPGAIGWIDRVRALLAEAGVRVVPDPQRGFDHGAWVPLGLMYPNADIPLLQLSLQPHLGVAHHLALGEALRPLRGEGVLLIGSGNLTHNLFEFQFERQAAIPQWVQAFRDWLAAALARCDRHALQRYRSLAPHAARNHLTEEHILPLFFALGAGGAAVRSLYSGYMHGVLAMDAYAFGD